MTSRDERDALVKRLRLIAEILAGKQDEKDVREAADLIAALTAPDSQAVAEPVLIGYLHVGGDFAGEREEWEFEAIRKACDALNQAAGVKEQRIAVYAHPTPSPDSVVVPREPTRDMLDEGFEAINKQYARDPLDDTLERLQAVYRAMLAAAPEAKGEIK